ncbi:MAG: iron-sulfur cluster assembly scaffold protein [Xanthobacteraceae bacterium]
MADARDRNDNWRAPDALQRRAGAHRHVALGPGSAAHRCALRRARDTWSRLNATGETMTAACREPCCSVAPRFTVADLFERGFRRMREAPLAIEGGTIADADGNAARFSIEVDDGKLADARFRASACTTLIAYCEAISELLPGFGVDVVAQLTANELVAALPGVPALKQDRAVLAIAAFRAALRAAIQREHIEIPSSSWPGLSRPSTP